jgi:hypothetical protein
MSKLTVSEYERLQDGPSFPLPVSNEPAAIEQTAVDFFGGEAKSEAFGSGTKFVIITTDADCHFLFGSDPTADDNAKYLAAGRMFCCGVRPGDKVSVIAAA